jgi:small conductance mechanosensitive channel
MPVLEHTMSERRRQRAETIGSILRSITSFTVLGLAFVLVLGELGINIAPIIASAGIVGIALGFGAQNLVKDFLSGIFMVLEDQYGVGDIIDLGEASGTVEAVGLRTTRLRDVHGTVWYVRNGEIIRVGNKSQGFAQVVLDVPMSHKADLEVAGQIMKETADALWQEEGWKDYVLEEPKYLGVEQINADGVVLRMTVKTRPGEQWRVGRELRLRIMERFDTENVDLAHPASQIFMRTERTGETGQTAAN